MRGTIASRRAVGDDGEWVTVAVYTLDGVEVSKEDFDAAFPDHELTGSGPGGHLPGAWPILSDVMGVHPDDIPAAAARDRQLGVPTGYTPDGRAVFESRGHRARFLKAHGYHDRKGGYGDG